MLELKGIKKVYKTGKVEFTALNGIDLTIHDGELIAILGKSGSGKTTLLNVIGLIDKFEEGEYLLNDKNVASMRENQKAEQRNKHIGIVLQDYSLINHKSVTFNVSLPLYFDKKCSVIQMKKRANEKIHLVGLDDQATKKVVNLSGGQKQRTAIARAIINDPEVILADEPTGALDTNTAKDIMDLLISLNKEGKTVIIVTHDIDIAKRCSRVIQLSDGRIISDEKSL